MKMTSKHPNYKIKETQFKSKITESDKELIKDMKANNRHDSDILYSLMQRYTDPKTKKRTIDIRTLMSWIEKN